MSLLGRALAREVRYDSGPYDYNAIPPPGLNGGISGAGVLVNDRSAIGLSTVYSCVRLIAGPVSTLPFGSFTQRDGVPIAVTNPDLIEDPFMAPYDTIAGLFQMCSSLALRGNSYSLVVARDELLRPAQLLPIHPDLVSVDRVRTGPLQGTVQYKVGYDVVDTDDIMHIPYFLLPGALTGLSPIDVARQGIGLALAAEEYGARFFGQGGIPSGVLESDDDLTPDQAKQIAQSWMAAHGGLNRANLPAVLGAGLTYKAITVTPEQAQFLATREWQRDDIAAMFGVPSSLLNGRGAGGPYGTGLEQQSLGFVRFTLRDYYRRIEDAFSRAMAKPVMARFDLSDLERADMMTRSKGYLQDRNAGWRTINDIRRAEKMPPVSGGDDPYTPLNQSATVLPPEEDTEPQAAPTSGSAVDGDPSGDQEAS